MAEQHLLLCRYHYDPLDRLAGVAAAADSGLASLLGFNGERRDPLTGHYLLGNGYRAFNPVLMRFNSPDSLSPFGEGGINAYAYCQGDPVNYQDPTGHIIGPGYRTPVRVRVDPFSGARGHRVAPYRGEPVVQAKSVYWPGLNARAESDIWTRNTYMGFYGQRPFERYRIYTVANGEQFHALRPQAVSHLDPGLAMQRLDANERAIDLMPVTDPKSFVMKKYALSFMQEVYAPGAVPSLDEGLSYRRLQDANRRAEELQHSANAVRGGMVGR